MNARRSHGQTARTRERVHVRHKVFTLTNQSADPWRTYPSKTDRSSGGMMGGSLQNTTQPVRTLGDSRTPRGNSVVYEALGSYLPDYVDTLGAEWATGTAVP